MKRISLIIEKDGNVRILDSCGLGMSCQQATADIEKVLGIVDEGSRAFTANYHQEIDPLTLNQDT